MHGTIIENGFVTHSSSPIGSTFSVQKTYIHSEVIHGLPPSAQANSAAEPQPKPVHHYIFTGWDKRKDHWLHYFCPFLVI